MPPTQPTTTPEPLRLYQPQNQPLGSLTLTRLAGLILTTHLSPLSIIQSGPTIDEVNYGISLTSRSHQGQLYQPDYPSQPELYGVENAVPLAASLGTEQASAVWSLSQAQANLACRGLWRIRLMKYIYDLLQTCIVPRYCVLSGWLPPDVFQAWQSETLQRRLCGTNAPGMLRTNLIVRDQPYHTCLSLKAGSMQCICKKPAIHGTPC